MNRPQPSARRGLSSTAEILLVLGVVILAIGFLPVATKVIGSQAQSVSADQQREIAMDLSDRIATVTSHATQNITVTYRPPVQQYVLTVKEQDTIAVQLPNTETQSTTIQDVTIENTQIEDADAICIRRYEDTVRLTEGVCPHLDELPPR